MEKKSILKIVKSTMGGICNSFKNLAKNTVNVLTNMLGITSIEVNEEEVIDPENKDMVDKTNLNIIEVGNQFCTDIKNVIIELKNNFVDYFKNAEVDASVRFNDINVKATNEGITIGLQPTV